nr:FAD-dependent oxidoreductase [Gemmatimonadales bacterium]
VIATGARAAVPAIRGLDGVPFLTNETVFTLTERPAHLMVLGGGPIGCELAQAFARLGTRVTLVQRDDRLLPHDDPDAAALVHSALLRDGVTLHLGHDAAAVEQSGTGIAVTVRRDGADRRIEGDRLLVALGRTPNIERLGLDAAGIASTSDGVTVNDRLQTSNRSVFAVGDVACRARFTHMADFEARLVVANALFYGRGKASGLIVPWATYTDPEVAHVGLSAEAVGRLGDRVQTVTLPLAEVDRAVLDDATDGFVRIHLAQGSDRILGATVVAEHAGEMLGELALAMTAGAGLATIGKTIHPYPTQAEAFRKAADRWRRGKLTPLVRRILALWFRFVN